ncbi:MAG: hypothetical protein QF594_04840 [Dehalococcoidales bacterium]|nr:hypothetical protein [Dehalococcoidales bacterium]
MKASDDACCLAYGITVFYYPACRIPVARDKKACPYCRVKIKDEQV